MTRLLTAAVLIAVVLLGVFSGSWWGLLLVITAIASATYIEYVQVLGIPLPMRILGLLAGFTLLIAPPDRVLIGLILFALLLLAFPLGSANLGAALAHSAALLLGVMYVFGGFKTAYLLGLRSSWLLLFSLAICWVGDSGAYYVGRSFGRTKLAPRISPGKSWEGALASALFSIAFSAFAFPRALAVSIPIAGLLGLAGNVAGQIGDLAESALKRAVGVKDSGKLLPGHGGMLDRVDSVLFTLPVIYALILALHL